MAEGKNELMEQDERSCHIDRKQFCDWLAGEMPPQKEEEFLGHIGKCTFCAQQFAEWMEMPQESAPAAEWMEMPQEPAPAAEWMEMPQEPPAYLKEEILQRASRMDVQVTVRVKERSRQMQLFMYSLRVGLAVMTSIFLLMLTANIQELQSEAVHDWKAEQVQQMKERENEEERMSITETLNQKSGEVFGFFNDISSGIFRIGIEETDQEGEQEVTR